MSKPVTSKPFTFDDAKAAADQSPAESLAAREPKAEAPETSPPPADDDGTVVVQVGRATYTLTPTPKAARAILRTYGGRFSPQLIQALSQADLDAMVVTIVAGAGLTKPSDGERLWDELWRLDPTPLADAAAACIRFAQVIRNGGRPLPKDGDAREDAAANEGGPEGNG